MHSPSPHRCRLIWARTVRPLALAIRLWRTIQDCSQQLLPEALSLLLPLNRSAAPLPILSVRADYAVGIGAHLCEPVLFAPPLSTLAAVFGCLLVCCLAIAVFLWIRIAPVAMLALPQARRSGPGGRRPRRVRRHGQQCFLCRGSRAQCEPRQRFIAARQELWPEVGDGMTG